MIWVSLLVTYILARLCGELVANLPAPEPLPPDAPEPDRRAEIHNDNVFYF
jgi:hypothetical protein